MNCFVCCFSSLKKKSILIKKNTDNYSNKTPTQRNNAHQLMSFCSEYLDLCDEHAKLLSISFSEWIRYSIRCMWKQWWAMAVLLSDLVINLKQWLKECHAVGVIGTPIKFHCFIWSLIIKNPCGWQRVWILDYDFVAN